MGGRKDGQMDGWVGSCTDGWVGGSASGWMDGWMVPAGVFLQS
jgi:hypothetical protein